MCALAPLNLFVILNTHVPEVLGEASRASSPTNALQRALRSRARSSEEGIDSSFQQPCDLSCLNGNVSNDPLDEAAMVDKLQPSADFQRSGGSDVDSSVDMPFCASRRCLGAAARCPGHSPWASSHHRGSGDDNRLNALLLGALGIAAFGYSPSGSSSFSRGPGAAIMGAAGVAAFSGDSAQTWTDEQAGQALDSGGNFDLDANPSGSNFERNTSPAMSSKFGGLFTGGATSSIVEEPQTCQCACPDVVTVPRYIVEQAALTRGALQGIGVDNDTAELGQRQLEKHVMLVMSYENILALVVITALSILGAIYLWKICTRKRCSCRMCQNKYRTLHLLGSGGYGQVYLVDRISDGEQFVSKRIPVRDITEVDEYSLEAKELLTLRHKHIVSYEDDFVHVEYGTFEPKTYFVIIMEFCPEGDLKEKIEVDFCNFTEDYVRTIFVQILDAVQYLHSKNVIHRDLKSQNVFLASDGRVRLGDFGLCKHTRAIEGVQSGSLTHAGTDCYMAPEMLSSSKYGKPADMWSLGCVLYELVTGQFMWELDGILGAMVMKDSQAVQKLLKENLVASVGNTITSLMKRLLSIRPEARPTITTCLRKKLFKPGFPLSKQPFGESFEELEAEELANEVQIEHPSSHADAEGSGDGNEDLHSSSGGEEDGDGGQLSGGKKNRKRRPRKKANKTPKQAAKRRSKAQTSKDCKD